MAKTYVMLYYDYRDRLEDLSNEQLGELVRAIFNYEIDKIEPNFNDPLLNFAFKFIKSDLERENKKYAEICEKNRANALKRTQATANDGKRTQAVGANKIKENKIKEEENKKETPKGVKEKGETSSPVLLVKSKRAKYIELVELSGLSTQVQEQLKEWLEYKKYSYQELGIKALLTTTKKNVDKYGEAAVCAVIVESMGNMWQGICWDKLERQGKGSSVIERAMTKGIDYDAED